MNAFTKAPVLVPDAVTVLDPFVDAGVFGRAEVQVCAAFARLVPDLDDETLIGLAIAVRGPRLGHVCIELSDAARLTLDRGETAADELPWPEVDRWVERLAASPLVASPATASDRPLRPLVLDGDRLYLQRDFSVEGSVAEVLSRLAARSGGAEAFGESAAVEAALERLFGPAVGPDGPDLQRRAAAVALDRGLAVIAGGPGTGKTRTIARFLAVAELLAAERGVPLDIGLAAPTGKAAARMTEALRSAVAEPEVQEVLGPDVAGALLSRSAVTIHRLLGSIPGKGFRRTSRDPLPHDVVVVDETSMVSLPLMGALLDALRPDARLVLVGDPHQLASIEAGTVLSDIVGPSGPSGSSAVGPAAAPSPALGPVADVVTVLSRTHRFGETSGIAELAATIRDGDGDAAVELLRSADRHDLTWVAADDVAGRAAVLAELVDAAVEVVGHATDPALEGQLPLDDGVARATAALAAASRVKLLAATHHGELGRLAWAERIEDALGERVSLRRRGGWYVGRPVLVTANDHPNRLSNGDVGVLVDRAEGRSVALAAGDGVRFVPPHVLDRFDTWWAMTVHKSQGSEFPHAVVSLPDDAASPVATRELLYTAVTRARERVTIVGDEAVLRAAISRPITRATGLRRRLWGTA